jgi:hypothetical protein
MFDQLLTSLGPIGYAAVCAGVGLVVGLGIGFALRKAPASAPMPEPAPAAPVDAKVETTESKGDKRRNPRRPGRSVEVFVHMPGQLQESSIKGVILNRSVGGLGILVGDEYLVGSTLGVLPAAASKLTPWVEVEVKSCRRNGEDWEIGVQFLKVPPYSTMVLFG